MEIHEAGEGAGIDNTSTKPSLYDETMLVTPDNEEFADVVLHDDKTNDEASHEEDNEASIAKFSGLSYLRKIWVVDNWAGGAYTYPLSFYITKIEDGVIEGRFSTSSVAFPDFYSYNYESGTDIFTL